MLVVRYTLQLCPLFVTFLIKHLWWVFWRRNACLAYKISILFFGIYDEFIYIHKIVVNGIRFHDCIESYEISYSSIFMMLFYAKSLFQSGYIYFFTNSWRKVRYNVVSLIKNDNKVILQLKLFLVIKWVWNILDVKLSVTVPFPNY